MKKKAIIVSGYFNPIHKGHLEYFNNAKDLADELFVIVNSDLQRALKESKEFQKEDERLFIVQNIKAVDKAIISIDETDCYKWKKWRDNNAIHIFPCVCPVIAIFIKIIFLIVFFFLILVMFED